MSNPDLARRPSALVEALLRLDGLGRLPRTGWLQAGVPGPESIAAHSLGVAYVALALAPREDPPIDAREAVALSVVHDAPEALLTDLPRTATALLGADAKRAAEAQAARELLEPLGLPAVDLYRTYADRTERAARFVALCDKLHLGLQLVHHARSGRRGLEPFEEGLRHLDCGGFRACADLRDELLRELEHAR